MKKKTNLEKYVEIQIELINDRIYSESVRYCKAKYQNGKLFSLCLMKKIGKAIDLKLETASFN